jgi:Domain of unknown function (DUF4185)
MDADMWKSREYIALMSVVLLETSGCGGSTADPPPSSGSLSGVLSVQSTDLGTLQQSSSIPGRDGAYSAAFQGYSVWLYGDTFLGLPNAAGHTFITNSWSYTTDFTAVDGITGFQERLDSAGARTQILQETADEQAFNDAHYGDTTCQVQPCAARWAIWPSSIVADPASDHALVFYMVESVDSNGFKGVGSSVAMWQSFDQLPQRPTFSPAIVADHPDLMFSQSEPTFGSASLIRNGVLYVYGCGNSLDGLDKGCRLGKVNPATVQDRSTWSFYAGNGQWSSSVSDAQPVFNGLDILSVSWNEYLQRYITVYSALFSQNVMVRTASAPEGPWSAEMVAFTALAPASGNTYDAQAHSEYDTNGGQTIFVTYSRDHGDFTSEVRLVRLDLTLTGTLP